MSQIILQHNYKKVIFRSLNNMSIKVHILYEYSFLFEAPREMFSELL